MKALSLLLLGGLASAAVGCTPGLSLHTAAPPNATAKFWPIDDKITVTAGVALGFDVFCPWTSCTQVVATTDAPTVARVYKAHFGGIHRDWVDQSASAVALVGLTPGTTTLHLWDNGHTHDFTVNVLPVGESAP